MLFPLGKKPTDERELVGLLLDCHARIRRFIDLACTLAGAAEVPAEEVGVAAGQVRRYFAEALPLHVADEDEDLAPALGGRDPEVDAALAAMTAEHRDHAPGLARLLELCAAIERDPQARSAAATELDAVARDLREQFRTHLEREERIVFPALGALPREVQATLLARVRARRAT